MILWTKIEQRGKGFYAYEITPKYDPKIKNTRSKKRYLGKVEGYNVEGDPIIKRRWIKKSVLKNVLESAISEKKTKSTLQFIQTLAFNDPYTMIDSDDSVKISSGVGKIGQTHLYYFQYSVPLKRNFELFVPLSTPTNFLMNIDEYRIDRKIKERPIFVFIKDDEANMAKINNSQNIVVRSQKYNNEKPKVELLDKSVYCSRGLNITDEHHKSILVVLLFKALVELIEKHQDFNRSICTSFNYTFKAIVASCFDGRHSPAYRLGLAYKELSRMATYIDLLPE
ncbi:MAG: hypothetical protein WCT14_03510 [Treponemataceae bacterium]|jgi:hypothetical protein